MRRPSPILRLGRSYQIAASPAGAVLANVGGHSLVSVWDVHNRSKIARLRDIKSPLSAALSHEGQRLAVKTVSGAIGIYDLASLQLMGTVLPTPTEGAAPAFSPDDRYIVDADWDGVISVIDTSTRDVTVLRRYANCMVTHIDHVSGSDRFLFLIQPKRIGVPAFSGEVLLEWRYPFDQHAPVEHVTSFRWLKTARLSPLHGMVAVLSEEPDGEGVVLLEQNMTDITARSETTRRSGSSYTRALAWSRDEQYLAVLRRHHVAVLEVATLTVVHEIAFEYACCVDFTADGTALLLGSWQSGYYVPLATLWTMNHLA
jgi:WD40 repeat protein